MARNALAARGILFFLLLLGTSAYARPTNQQLKLTPGRTVAIDGVISNGNILKLAPVMDKMAAAKPGAPIDIVINSPGGDVLTGFVFINVMEELKARGTPLRCFVPTIAASMAFQILVHCSERHVLDRAFLLWHRVRVVLGGGLFATGVPLTAPQASELAKDLQETDDLILQEMVDAFGEDMEEDVIAYHFERETLHVGEQLSKALPTFITHHKAIPGLIGAILDPKTPRGPTDHKSVFKLGTIVYIKN